MLQTNRERRNKERATGKECHIHKERQKKCRLSSALHSKRAASAKVSLFLRTIDNATLPVPRSAFAEAQSPSAPSLSRVEGSGDTSLPWRPVAAASRASGSSPAEGAEEAPGNERRSPPPNSKERKVKMKTKSILRRRKPFRGSHFLRDWLPKTTKKRRRGHLTLTHSSEKGCERWRRGSAR